MTASPKTISEVFEQTQDELIAIVDKHTLAVQSWLSSRSPQAKTFQGKGVRASSTGFRLPLLNLALGCNFPTNTSTKEIETEIEEIKHFFAQRNVPWYWWMNVSPSPPDIEHTLKTHGLAHDKPPLPAMAASVKQDFENFPKYRKDIYVWQAHTIDDLKAASKIRRIAFQFREGEALTYFEDMSLDWLENKSVTLFLAGVNKMEPVSIGAMILSEGIPGVYVMATLPEHHRKGYGKAILTALMHEAASQGHSLLALTASKAGFGLYSQFGFHHIFDFDFYSIPA